MSKISIFTTLTDPKQRQDCYIEALTNYLDLADEVVVIDGSKINDSPFGYDGKKAVLVWSFHNDWPKEFDWRLIGEQFTRGYDACSGDWVIRMDSDFVFHENDFDYIRDFLDHCDAPVACFPKRQILKHDSYAVKAIMPIAFNKKKYGKRIRLDAGGDLCQPSLDGKEIEKSKMPVVARSVPIVVSRGLPQKQLAKRLPHYFIKNGITYTYSSFVPVWNYECLLRTRKVEAREFYRFARAWGRTFGKNMMGIDSEKKALEEFIKMQVGRYKNSNQITLRLEDHPAVMRETIKNLKPEQWGFDGWGNLK